MAFCTKFYGGRMDLSKPWALGDYVYASDSHVIVRMRRELLPDDPDAFNADGNDKWADSLKCALNDELLLRADYSLAMEATVRYGIDCRPCEGSGEVFDVYAWRECDECEGKGIAECPRCGHSRDRCDRCHGMGKIHEKIPCASCGGAGKTPAPVLGNVKLEPERLRLVADVFGDVTWGGGIPDWQVVYFQTGDPGVVGGVCGTRVNYDGR